MTILIVEGVTGAGKTSTIKALNGLAEFHLIDENETFDNFMSEFSADPKAASRHSRTRISAILAAIAAGNHSQHYVLERFYFSQLALGADPISYRDIEKRCLALGCKVVTLHISRDLLLARSLLRREYGGRDWQGLIPHYGSEQKALEAIDRSQKARIEAIERSGLEYRLIETNQMAWARYAAEIAQWAGMSRWT